MPRIEIDRLSLRLSGLTEDQGRLLANRIAEGLAASGESGSIQEVDALKADARMTPGSSINMLADQIIADLLRQLSRTL